MLNVTPSARQPNTHAAAWTFCVDGSATSGGSGAGLIVVSPTGRVYEQALKFLFRASNNEAEYEALLAEMDLCYTLGAEHLCVFSDFQLIVSQVMREYEARDAVMAAYLSKVKERAKCIKKFEIKHVPRSENRQACSFETRKLITRWTPKKYTMENIASAQCRS